MRAGRVRGPLDGRPVVVRIGDEVGSHRSQHLPGSLQRLTKWDRKMAEKNAFRPYRSSDHKAAMVRRGNRDGMAQVRAFPTAVLGLGLA